MDSEVVDHPAARCAVAGDPTMYLATSSRNIEVDVTVHEPS
jgi:hypothetical protein